MEIKKWTGLRNTTAPEGLKPGELSVAQNVDIDNGGKLLSRKGQMVVQSGSHHSLWASDKTCFVMVGQDMKRFMEDGSLVQVTRLQSGRPVSFMELGGVVYFSNNFDTGRIVNGTALEWGIRPPKRQPKAQAYPGTLPPGRYMYAMTFLRSDGLESGTGMSGFIELESRGGILFSDLEISTNPEISGKILYLSTANGMKLYRAAMVGPTVTQYAYMNGGQDLTVELDTQFVEPAPAGHIVETHSGIAYVIEGNVAWYSDAYSPERFRFADGRFFQLPGRITLWASVGDGIFAATDKGTWFLRGHEPSQMTAVQVSSVGAIEGTVAKFDENELDEEGQETGRMRIAAMWTTPNGIVIGSSNGQIRNATENKYGFPGAQRGAAVVRSTRGFTQYVSSLQGTGAAPNIYE